MSPDTARKKNQSQSKDPAASQRRSKPPAPRRRLVYAFGAKTDGNAALGALLGGKGANLAEMAAIGLPVPPGFTISTEVCHHYHAHNGSYPATLDKAVTAAIHSLEKQLGKGFGTTEAPLLVAVRSGARESMPGMMDTILNLGLNDATVAGLAEATGDSRFAWDCYRRFIQMYGSIVMGVRSRNEQEEEPFAQILSELKRSARVADDAQLTAEHLQDLVRRYKALIRLRAGCAFPQDVGSQLWGAIGAVFKSWNNDRAVLYRQRYGIPASWGTAVTVQAMVFGNAGKDSAAGVAFTRDPANGAKTFYGEFLENAQGEDVVAGIRTPRPIAELRAALPESFADLEKVRGKLERHFGDMQDFEFTVENGRLFLLQTRDGKRTGLAAVRIAVEMNRERLMDRKTALLKIPPDSIDSLLVPVFDPRALRAATRLTAGLPAGPGAASGRIAFTAAGAEIESRSGNRVILCRTETSPDDLRGMLHSQGILTSRGGVSSHAALVARQLGKVCVCGAGDIKINYERRILTVGNEMLREGDYLSIDGGTGAVYKGMVENAPSEVKRVLDGKLKPEKSYAYQLFKTVMDWSDRHRRLKVRANADTAAMAHQAVANGAEGIGLCRTEHMFFDGDRIDHMREMILAADDVQRRVALRKLLPFQRQDFVNLFRAMGERPVTIRLLDPPLHEFLPQDDVVRRQLAEKLGMPLDAVIDRVKSLHEENPMLGCRGCRLGILHPEITEMQARAVFEAAATVMKGTNKIKVCPEIMIPLVGFRAELANQLAIVHRVAKEVMQRRSVRVSYQVGTMIEIPRAAITADELAREADFFSFGTNDLTQTTLGLSRDDMGLFHDDYQRHDIYARNPFAGIDESGVGKLMVMAAEKGRASNARLKLGICGEHAGDPQSVEFCHRIGLDYVSCSPPRVPVARLAAAQAQLREKLAKTAAENQPAVAGK